MIEKVFILTHVHEAWPGHEDIKIIGIYSTQAKAEAAVARTKLLPGFESVPEGFHIDVYPLDQDHWVNGYTTVA